MEAELRHVLEAAFPGEEARYFLPMSIGSTPETADEGAVLILNGTKTITSSPFWDYPDGKIPFVGALGVLLDGSRRPRGGIVTLTSVGPPEPTIGHIVSITQHAGCMPPAARC